MYHIPQYTIQNRKCEQILSHISQDTIQNRNVHIFVLNGILWDMKQVPCGTCEIGL